MADEKKTPKKSAPKKPAKPKLVKLCYPHTLGKPGDVKIFYNVVCYADENGFFHAEVEPEVAERELARESLYRFEKA